MGWPESDTEAQAHIAAFRDGFQKLGWTEGRNIRIETRFAPAGTQAQVLAKELVDLGPDVLLAHSAQIAAALHRQTRAIPIVFVNVSDPIGAGFVDTLARPGGNLTGLLHYEEGIVGKWLALLKEIAPRLARAALVDDPKSPVHNYFVRSANAASASLAIEVVAAPVENAADIERFFETFALVPDGGLLRWTQVSDAQRARRVHPRMPGDPRRPSSKQSMSSTFCPTCSSCGAFPVTTPRRRLVSAMMYRASLAKTIGTVEVGGERP